MKKGPGMWGQGLSKAGLRSQDGLRGVDHLPAERWPESSADRGGKAPAQDSGWGEQEEGARLEHPGRMLWQQP